MPKPTIGQRLRDIIGDALGAQVAEFQLEKAIQSAKDASRPSGVPGPISNFYDPISIFMGREWLVKRNVPLTYSDMRQMAKNPIIGSIIQTRLTQVAGFCKPQVGNYDHGYVIKTDDEVQAMDVAKAKEISHFLHGAGLDGYGEDSLEAFARKYVRDSLILDQACGEVVYRNNGLPAYFVAVDSATIRRLRASLEFATPERRKKPIYCQILQDRIVAAYTEDELMFGVRNPQTDITYCGYGMSELELLIRIVTTIYNTEKYNTGTMTQGGTAKGVLVVKGDGIDDTQFQSFKRDFREAVRNASDNWRPPVLRVGNNGDVNWLQLDRSNRDMEYARLFDYLVKQSCGVYQISPEEINWSIGTTGAKATFESHSDQKIQQSQKKGLKPLLAFLGDQLTYNIVKKFDSKFRIEFVGLDLDKDKESEIRAREVRSYITVDQARAKEGLGPLEVGGNIILNEIWLKAYMMEKFGIDESGNPTGPSKDGKKRRTDDKGSGIISRGDFRDTSANDIRRHDLTGRVGADKSKDPVK